MHNEWTKYNECKVTEQQDGLHRDTAAVPQETRRTPLEDSYVFASICTQEASTIVMERVVSRRCTQLPVDRGLVLYLWLIHLLRGNEASMFPVPGTFCSNNNSLYFLGIEGFPYFGGDRTNSPHADGVQCP
jgi:hypothetical protein